MAEMSQLKEEGLDLRVIEGLGEVGIEESVAGTDESVVGSSESEVLVAVNR